MAKDEKTKTETETDNELTPNEETSAMSELQRGYEKQIEQLKAQHKLEVDNLKAEHNKQIRNILLGKDLLKDEEGNDEDDKVLIDEMIKNINKGR